jgi:dUTP pyrophosphatase
MRVSLEGLSRGDVYVIYKDPLLKPRKAHGNDTGLDLYSDVDVELRSQSVARVKVDARCVVHYYEEEVAFDTPCDIQIRGRSGLAAKGILAHVGTIDAGWRGELEVILFNLTDKTHKISRGDKVGQLIIPVDFFYVVTSEEEFDNDGSYFCRPEELMTDRGNNGFGSTGK